MVGALFALTGCTTGDDTAAAESIAAPPTSAPADTAPTAPTAPAAPTTMSEATTSTSTSTIASTTTSSTTATTTPTTTASVARPPAADAGTSIYDVRPPSDIEPPPLPAGWDTEVIGSSSQGRDIVALVRPVEAPRRRVLVIGGIHGNEPVTPPTVRSLVETPHDPDVEVWLVAEANPDGVAAGTRWNANGVDLNRNFNWGWRADDGGTGPLSEPETQALTTLIERLRPDVVVWVHQPYGYTSSIGDTDRSLERAWADASGVPVRSGVTQHGGGESWSNFVGGVPSMLIEIDSWAATPEVVAAHRAGYEAMLHALG